LYKLDLRDLTFITASGTKMKTALDTPPDAATVAVDNQTFTTVRAKLKIPPD